MKISIIVPVYNGEKYIKKCIDSLIKQTYENIEIIVINDGSTDNTKAICESYSDKRLIVVNNSNHGVSYSRNDGIKRSNGDYITFVDADDWIEDNCIEKNVRILEKNKNIDVLRYNYKLQGGKAFQSNNLYELSNKMISKNEFDNSFYKHFISDTENIPCLVMLLFIRKEIIKKIHFNEKLTMMEDVDFYFQIFREGSIFYFSKDELYNYYINSNSVTHSKKLYLKNILGTLDTNKELKKYISDNKELSEKIDITHLRIIAQFLKKSYISDKKDYRKNLEELIRNEQYQNIKKIYNKMSKGNRMFYWTIEKKHYFMNEIYLKLIKIKNKIEKRW